MKIFELAERLKKIYDKHGDIEVMFESPEDGSIWSVLAAEPDEVTSFPEDWNMPVSLKFVRLGQF